MQTREEHVDIVLFVMQTREEHADIVLRVMQTREEHVDIVLRVMGEREGPRLFRSCHVVQYNPRPISQP